MCSNCTALVEIVSSQVVTLPKTVSDDVLCTFVEQGERLSHGASIQGDNFIWQMLPKGWRIHPEDADMDVVGSVQSMTRRSVIVDELGRQRMTVQLYTHPIEGSGGLVELLPIAELAVHPLPQAHADRPALRLVA